MKACSTAFGAWLAEVRPAIDAALAAALRESSYGRAPEPLRAAVQTALLAGGKRLRPALALLACEAHGGARERALPGALACEMIHAYSLVHDDLPCMDDDDLRRGLPTIHVQHGEAVAVLAGDALQALAFETLARQPDAETARSQVLLLAAACGAGGMVGGQVLDVQAEGAPSSLHEVDAIHAAKTAALITAALQLGACAAGAEPARWREQASPLARYGWAVGRLFQATDDLLDVTASTSDLGKTAGKDGARDKATLVRAAGLAGARARLAELAQEALDALGRLAPAARRPELRDLPEYLMERCR